MPLTTTLIFYLLIGAAVAAAVALSDEDATGGERVFRFLTAVVFWPMYVPILLRPPRQPAQPVRSTSAPARPGDDMAAAIAQVEAELETALDGLDGWAESVLARENLRAAELTAAWNLQADRIRELDRLLAQPEFLTGGVEPEGVCPSPSGGEPAEETEGDEPPGAVHAAERVRLSEQSRRENIRRLRRVRDRMYDDLMGTLAWVRELVTMIHLAKYTGAPASRAEELVAQIAAAVEGLSEVTGWQDEPLAETASAGGR